MARDKAQILATILSPDDLILEWRETETTFPDASLTLQRETFRRFHSDSDQWLFRLGFTPESIPLPEDLAYWRRFAAAFIHDLALTPDLEESREQAAAPASDPVVNGFLETAPPFDGHEHLTASRLVELWESLNAAYQRAAREHAGTIESFFHSLRPDLELAGRVFLHLVENKKGASAPFAFLATYSTRTDESGTTRHVPLKNALREYEGNQEKLLELLATVYKAAKESELLTDLLESGRIFHPLSMTGDRALTFLKEVPLYERSGVRCRIPNWWTAKSTKVSVSINVGDKKPSRLGFDALVSCAPTLRVGDEVFSPEEAQRLLEEAEGLMMIKNKWVEVDKEKLEKTLDAYAKASELLADGISFRDAMRMILNPNAALEDVDVDGGVNFGDWLQDVTRKLADPKLVRNVTPAAEFKADLRPYQKLGLNWLAFLDSLGFGPCLADDMGLGKTIQVLAFLSVLARKKNGPSLLVVPASLMTNWRNEIDRFLPTLKVVTIHGSAIGAKAREGLSEKELSKHDLAITTYGMAHRNEWLGERGWDYVILDEAQAIKNPGTRQTRAVKQLKCRNRMVLTGTPVENRLGDLWSIFDFLNPGLLGSSKEFKALAGELAKSEDGYARLRRVVSPYILRRLKTDKTVISDLPDKVEMKAYAELSRKQAVIYEGLVADLKGALDETEGMRRRGLILAYLMKFKQLCNHPDHYTGGGPFKAADSGKFSRLKEICETILAKRERLLVFTQFREMTAPLDRFLADVFGRQGLVFHGGVSVKKRQTLVERFQNAREYVPYMVLSLKAAGVGLNLTRANHVVHFDRWWNPAVENQATDRVFRIGQTRNVTVHKFITQGTVEEKIDEMIGDKTALADEIVGAANENWITEMDDKRLFEMFSLNPSP